MYCVHCAVYTVQYASHRIRRCNYCVRCTRYGLTLTVCMYDGHSTVGKKKIGRTRADTHPPGIPPTILAELFNVLPVTINLFRLQWRLPKRICGRHLALSMASGVLKPAEVNSSRSAMVMIIGLILTSSRNKWIFSKKIQIFPFVFIMLSLMIRPVIIEGIYLTQK